MPDDDNNAGTQTDGAAGAENQAAAGATPPADLDAFIATLADDDTKKLVTGLRDKWHEGQVTGLKSALTKEREAAEDASKKLRELAKTADVATAEKLNALATEKDAEIDTARKESTFYREASAAGVTSEKLERAWLICKNAGYFDKRGNPDIAAMKAEIPELFAVPVVTTKVDAGKGTQQKAVPEEIDPLRAAVARARHTI